MIDSSTPHSQIPAQGANVRQKTEQAEWKAKVLLWKLHEALGKPRLSGRLVLDPGRGVENALIYGLGYADVAASPDISFVSPAVDFRVAVSSLLSRIPE